jgi:hypothetical protein
MGKTRLLQSLGSLTLWLILEGEGMLHGRSAMWSLLAARQDRGQPGASDKVVIALAGALHPAVAATREAPTLREGEQTDCPFVVCADS